MVIIKNPDYKNLINHNIGHYECNNPELLNILKSFSQIEKELLEKIGSSKQTLEPVGSWVNYYHDYQSNEFHNHLDMAESCDYIGIQILETGDEPEMIICYEEPETRTWQETLGRYSANPEGKRQEIHAVAGDFIVIHVSIIHGLPKVKNKLKALMLKIKT